MRWLFLAFIITLGGCQPRDRVEPLTMVVGSWYGFYPFYFAVENGLDTRHGLRLKIVEPNNVANFRRGYLRSQVDVAATSMLELTNASRMSGQRLLPIVITDYSNGGDVIVSRDSIQTIEQLRGKRIAVPSKGIAEYIMSVVFETPHPTHHFIQIQIPENECDQAFKEGTIDACVTYPPISTYLLEQPDLHSLYSTAEDPQRVFDVVWVKPSVSAEAIDSLQALWFDAVKLVKQDETAFYQFVADISEVSVTSVEASMQGIQLIGEAEFKALLDTKEQLSDDLVTACTVAGNSDCERYRALLWEAQ